MDYNGLAPPERGIFLRLYTFIYRRYMKEVTFSVKNGKWKGEDLDIKAELPCRVILNVTF